MTPAERQAILETKLDNVLKAMEAMSDDIKALTNQVEALKVEVREDKAELAAIKNRGKGILIGVALSASAMGAAFANKVGALLAAIAGVFRG